MKTDYFNHGFSEKVVFSFLLEENNYQNTIKPRKTTISSTLIEQIKVSGSESDVVNQISSSLNRGTIKITFTVPLIQFTTFLLFKDKITEIYPKRKVYFREN